MEDIAIKKLEDEKDRIHSVRIERNSYLGEYKERVMLALTIEEASEKEIYLEVEEAIKKPEAEKIVISKDVNCKSVKKYVFLARKYNKMCKKMDFCSSVGDIGLVVVSHDKYNREDENGDVVVKSKLERFREKGLPDVYFEAQGKKISKMYLDVIKKELPELAKDYKEITLVDRLFGVKCPIYEKLGGKIK